PAKVLLLIVWFTGSITIEKLHPLEGGVLRRKVRRDRRAGLPIEPALLFYPKYLFGILAKQTRWALLYLRLGRIYLAIKHDPKNKEYMDLALSPVADDEESRELFHTPSAEAFVRQEKRLDKIGRGEAAAYRFPLPGAPLCAPCAGRQSSRRFAFSIETVPSSSAM